ncbi:MAG: double zinc ribbon domain-containing protein [bacterium]
MKTAVIELLFPRFCLGCGYVGEYICGGCEKGMKKIKKTACFYCGRPSLFGLTHPRCKKTKGIDGHLSLYTYDGLFKKLLQETKYKGAHLIMNTLLSFPQQPLFHDLNKWNNLFDPLVVSVPLHPQRIRERGFNQVDIITKHYFSDSHFLKGTILKRTVNTEHLANMKSKNKRKKHIHDAFKFTADTVPEAVLLVDDVITTGSTILECAKIVKESGVQIVLAFSLAKG